MNEKLLHTPEGVRDVYDMECRRKRLVLHKLHHVLELYGYHDIETPTFEYFDIFNRDKGSAKSNEMYKFFDRENNTLVLRPDMTPSIARCVAKYYAEEELPLRLCYEGNTYKNIHNLQGKLKETTEIGAELVNDDSSAADAEIIAAVVDCFLASGLTEFQIEVGNVNFFKGLVAEAGLDAQAEDRLREFIHNKNSFGLTEYVKTLDMCEDIKQAFMSFDSLFGGMEMLDRAKKLVSNHTSLEAITRLEKLYKALSYYGYEKYIGCDLGMLSRYEYYTGIIFRGYTYGTGDAIAKGGRYNTLLKQFGKDAPAIGFGFNVDEIMLAIARQKVDVEIDYTSSLIVYDREHQEIAIDLGNSYRRKDKKVELIRKSERKCNEDYMNYARRQNFTELIFVEDNEKAVFFDVQGSETRDVSIRDLQGIID